MILNKVLAWSSLKVFRRCREPGKCMQNLACLCIVLGPGGGESIAFIIFSKKALFQKWLKTQVCLCSPSPSSLD